MAINTGIKANDKFMEILSACIGQMSDGIWENTRSMEKYWKSLAVTRSPDGYIIINDRNFVCNDPVDFMANKIKQILKIEIDDGRTDMSWDRLCSATTIYLNYYEQITVGDCYKLYELLKGRDVSKKKYATYETYDVTLNVNGHIIVERVSALNERSAKNLAINQLTKRITASVAVRD
jgi:hypothetical protein